MSIEADDAASVAGTVQTVLGPVPASDLGRVLHHEHLLSLTPGAWLSGGGDDPALIAEDQVERAVGALRGARAAGVGTVVDLSPYGVVGRDERGENVVRLQEISRRAGVHVVTGTAVYLESFSPVWTVEASLDDMTARFVRDAARGIAGTGVRAGVLGEQATGLDVITAHEEKCLRAAARAHAETGLALVTHTTHGTMALEQVELLRSEGVDLARVVIGHMDTHPDTDYVRRVLDTGVHVAFDTIGKQLWDFRVEPLPADLPDGPMLKDAYHRSDVTRADRVAALVAEGYGERVLLAQDLTGEEVSLNPGTHGVWGYGYLTGPFAAMLRERGVGEDAFETMLTTTPARLLAV
ncbi:phosphotriesterase-related protein [Sediminihabitans luteus]|uniref:Phosphotriesterase-related protein n=1 Tax=Sediminihabitans luteus TaxID=1138585 RepID=A0A2M9CES2_9CELL|nr:hypothetical protein [Sediminihabitans luteus]PJJ70431.1 phosphotriesterase-related protein [Sediminihabitans luteus]GII97904.1 hydrolase [Sediminihabitans luteus]